MGLQDRQSGASPAWLLLAGASYFVALLFAKERLQLILLFALAIVGILILRQSLRQVGRRVATTWLMLVLAGIIHFSFRWWLAPDGSLTAEGMRWLNESLFFTARLFLFLVCGIVLGIAHPIESYVSALMSRLSKLLGVRTGSQAGALLTCAWTIVPSVRDHHRLRTLARRARRIPRPDGTTERLAIMRGDFFSAVTTAVRHADSIALNMWTREVDSLGLSATRSRAGVVPALACGVFCFLCLSILPL